MNQLWYALAVYAIGTVLHGPVHASESSTQQVRNVLERMTQAVQTLNYEGTFVYKHDDLLEAMRIIRKVGEGGERERLVSLNGEAREVIRENGRVTCILPNAKSVLVDKSIPRTALPAFGRSVERLRAFYAFELEGTERVAGRMASKVAVTPRDPFRYGYRLWVDDEHGLLLRSDLVGNRGNAVEQIMFTDVRIHQAIPDELLTPDISGKEFTWHQEDETSQQLVSDDSDWRVTRLPAGFALTHHNRHLLPDQGEPVNHLVYSDGLAWVSVYVEPKRASVHALRGASRMGAVNAFGREVQGHQVTVVGEVPHAAVKLIAEAVEYRRQERTP